MNNAKQYRILKDAIYTLKDSINYVHQFQMTEKNFYTVTGSFEVIKSVEQAMLLIDLSDKSVKAKQWALTSFICDEYQNMIDSPSQHCPSRNGRIYVLAALMATINTLEKEGE